MSDLDRERLLQAKKVIEKVRSLGIKPCIKNGHLRYHGHRDLLDLYHSELVPYEVEIASLIRDEENV